MAVFTANRTLKRLTAGEKGAYMVMTVMTEIPVIADWTAFYGRYFGMKADFSGIAIPKEVDGFNRLVVVAKGICLSRILNAYSKHEIPIWPWWSGSLPWHGGLFGNEVHGPDCESVTESYAFLCRDEKEADEDADMKNLSIELLAARRISVESLTERLLHGLKFFDETNWHMDEYSATLCVNFRHAFIAAKVDYRSDDGYVYIGECLARDSEPVLCARRTIRAIRRFRLAAS